MKQNEKDLLVKDLCARLPYGVKFVCNKNIYTAKGLDLIVTDEGDWEYAVTAKGITPIEIDFIKPYLFHLSSMTEEQLNDFYATIRPVIEEALDAWKNDKTEYEGERPITLKDIKADIVAVNWMLKNHFDMNGLIPKGLAIDCTNLNIY